MFFLQKEDVVTTPITLMSKTLSVHHTLLLFVHHIKCRHRRKHQDRLISKNIRKHNNPSRTQYSAVALGAPTPILTDPSCGTILLILSLFYHYHHCYQLPHHPSVSLSRPVQKHNHERNHCSCHLRVGYMLGNYHRLLYVTLRYSNHRGNIHRTILDPVELSKL